VNVLGLDTSTPSSAVGLLVGTGDVLEASDRLAAGARPRHQARLLPLAASLLARAGFGWERVDRIAVGLGPGTFTGLRVGVATARGLAQSLGVELVGVSSSMALAYAAFDRLGAEHEGCVLTLVDARRGELFVAAYGAAAKGTLPVILSPPKPIAPENVTSVLAEVRAAAQSEGGGKWLAVGDGAPALRGALTAAAVEVAPNASPLHHVSGGAVCVLGSHIPVQEIDAVVPEYCRRADAELAFGGRSRDPRAASPMRRRGALRRAAEGDGRLLRGAAQ
jgi:tRNA threonylcarbamoyladenosine biosynthesis protein TsaB